MTKLLLPLLPVFIVVLLKLLKLISTWLKFSGSQYKQVSGNGFFKTVFDKGRYGEFLIFCMLEDMGEKYILTNLYLPQKNGSTTEVDLLMVNTTGIYVFESKNYGGWIFGDEKSKMWTQTFKTGQKNKFYNPIWQNKGHISALDAFLNKQYGHAFYSYIVFSNRCELKKVSYTSTDVAVIYRDKLMGELMNRRSNLLNKLSAQQAQDIYERLKLMTMVDSTTKKRHIEEIKSKYMH